jgi:6-phosphofructokinase 2
MADVLTITLNPAVDVSTSVARIVPAHKLRCEPERRDPGGGGVNVARVIQRMGGSVLAAVIVGGPVGLLLAELLASEGLATITIPTSGETRESFAIVESATGAEFRFVLPGPVIEEAELNDAIKLLAPAIRSARFVVCSGSLPRGVPETTYATLADTTKRCGGKFVVDASGAALKAALMGGVYLVKPSLHELQDFVGAPLSDPASILGATRALVEQGRAQIAAVTLGAGGALLVTHERAMVADALPMQVASSVGAGDGFLGAMVWSLAAGHDLEAAFRHAMAAAAASLQTPGTQLCQRADVMRLATQVCVRSL